MARQRPRLTGTEEAAREVESARYLAQRLDVGANLVFSRQRDDGEPERMRKIETEVGLVAERQDEGLAAGSGADAEITRRPREIGGEQRSHECASDSKPRAVALPVESIRARRLLW
jgi:hypothetical protein